MTRLLTITFLLWLVSVLPNAMCAQNIDSVNTNQTTNELERYEAVINAFLRTNRDEEKKYISDSFDLLRDGKLPKEVIDRSFLWVRKNRSHKSYRFIYFEQVMRIYAKQVKATVPVFDYSVYNVRGSQVVPGINVNGAQFSSAAVGSSTFGSTTQKSSVEPSRTFRSFIFGRKKK